jgi:hypothetical protein
MQLLVTQPDASFPTVVMFTFWSAESVQAPGVPLLLDPLVELVELVELAEPDVLVELEVVVELDEPVVELVVAAPAEPLLVELAPVPSVELLLVVAEAPEPVAPPLLPHAMAVAMGRKRRMGASLEEAITGPALVGVGGPRGPSATRAHHRAFRG